MLATVNNNNNRGGSLLALDLEFFAPTYKHADIAIKILRKGNSKSKGSSQKDKTVVMGNWFSVVARGYGLGEDATL